VDFSDVGSKEMIEASVLSFGKEYSRMVEMFRRITSPITPQEQQTFCNMIGVNRTVRKR
jgi:cell filamentation protein